MELYLKDCYLKEFETTVREVYKDKFIVLEQSAFYPNSGGQPHDTGTIATCEYEYKVIYVGKFKGNISHEVDKPGLKAGEKVKCKIDWNTRYLHMRHHTAAHVLSEVINRETGAKITGNQLSTEKGRIDFDLENYDPEKMKEMIEKANDVVEKNLEVKKYFLAREEALSRPELFQLKNVLPPDVQDIRIVEIVGFCITACGGTHVNNTKEIGKIMFLKSQNKGKNNRRLYFTLK